MHHIQNTFVEGSRKLKSFLRCEIKSSTQSITETWIFNWSKIIHLTQLRNEVDHQPKHMYTCHFKVVKYLHTIYTLNHSYFSVLKSWIIQDKFKELDLWRVLNCMLSNTDQLAKNEEKIGHVLSGSTFHERDARAVVDLDRFYIETS